MTIRIACLRKGQPPVRFSQIVFLFLLRLDLSRFQREQELTAVIEKATAELQKNSERRKVRAARLVLNSHVDSSSVSVPERAARSLGDSTLPSFLEGFFFIGMMGKYTISQRRPCASKPV